MRSDIVRPLHDGEAWLFESLPDSGLVGRAAFGQRYVAHDGGYLPEWTWVALRDGQVVARAAWWGGPDDDRPRTLDWLDFTDADAAVALLDAAPFTCDYLLDVPVGWRDRADVRCGSHTHGRGAPQRDAARRRAVAVRLDAPLRPAVSLRCAGAASRTG